jgi:hypothetical protein
MRCDAGRVAAVAVVVVGALNPPLNTPISNYGTTAQRLVVVAVLLVHVEVQTMTTTIKPFRP